MLLEDGVWKEISSLFDEKWQVLVFTEAHVSYIFPLVLKFWKLCVNSLMKIQLWAYDSGKKFCHENYIYGKQMLCLLNHIQVIISFCLFHAGNMSSVLFFTRFLIFKALEDRGSMGLNRCIDSLWGSYLIFSL